MSPIATIHSNSLFMSSVFIALLVYCSFCLYLSRYSVEFCKYWTRRLILTSPSFGAVISAAPVVLEATIPSASAPMGTTGLLCLLFITGKTPPSNPPEFCEAPASDIVSLNGLQGLTRFSIVTGALPMATGDQLSLAELFSLSSSANSSSKLKERHGSATASSHGIALTAVTGGESCYLLVMASLRFSCLGLVVFWSLLA